MKKFTTIALSAVVAMFGATAMAQPTDSDDVLVNIEVAAEVQLWSNDASVQLTLDGKNAENSDAVASSLSIINNVDANITAGVTGTLPTPIVSGGGIQFFIFPEEDDTAAAFSAIAGNAYNPAGALAWDISTLGTTQTAIASTGVNTSIDTVDVVYAAATPGELPLPDNFSLTVTWTITGN